ncbi:lysM domain receptor-like kinase 3 [Diospyros lotus]|uniref:lysM domain receptor-like kinase 3 n=1 Tax=Diospyros lotus TaxID=55363 RepID=UPI002251E9EF|nr:lysM domain receptor-like kinase 3 [Diospyros lotus]
MLRLRLRLRLRLGLGLGFLAVVSVCVVTVESRCSGGCDLALGSYYVWGDSNLSFIGEVMAVRVAEIVSYNPDEIPNQDYVQTDVRINIPFRCDCINNEFLGRVFRYSVRSGDTYERIATLYYSNLTTAAWVQKFNSYGASSIPDNATVNVTVNCSCGDSTVSENYGLFITYPLRTGDTLESVASAANLSTDLVRSYNRNANFSAGSGLVYIPGKV